MAKITIEAQDCRLCKKRDTKGGCSGAGPCIYVDKIAAGNTRLKERTINPKIAERMGERGYLSAVELQVGKQYQQLVKRNPKYKRIVDMKLAGKSVRDISRELNVSASTISRVWEMWLSMRENTSGKG